MVKVRARSSLGWVVEVGCMGCSAIQGGAASGIYGDDHDAVSDHVISVTII